MAMIRWSDKFSLTDFVPSPNPKHFRRRAMKIPVQPQGPHHVRHRLLPRCQGKFPLWRTTKECSICCEGPQPSLCILERLLNETVCLTAPDVPPGEDAILHASEPQ